MHSDADGCPGFRLPMVMVGMPCGLTTAAMWSSSYATSSFAGAAEASRAGRGMTLVRYLIVCSAESSVVVFTTSSSTRTRPFLRVVIGNESRMVVGENTVLQLWHCWQHVRDGCA